MALTDHEKQRVAHHWLHKVFKVDGNTANLTVADIVAAAAALDAALGDATGATTVQQYLLAQLPEPFASGTNAGQKWLLMACIAGVQAGILM